MKIQFVHNEIQNSNKNTLIIGSILIVIKIKFEYGPVDLTAFLFHTQRYLTIYILVIIYARFNDLLIKRN